MVAMTVGMDVIDLREADNKLVTGSQVDNLQGLLKGTRNPAWDPGPIDSLGGPRTMAAAIAYQEDNTLEPDAIDGPLTWGELIASSLSLAVGLPLPTNGRGPSPVDALQEFAGLTPQSSFEGLVGEVVAEIARRNPQPELLEPTGTEVAWATRRRTASSSPDGASSGTTASQVPNTRLVRSSPSTGGGCRRLPR